MLVLLWLVLLFVLLPLTVGWVVPRLATAMAVWIALGSWMAVLQSQDDELGGGWVIVALFVLVGVAFVYGGHSGRRRRTGAA